MVNKNQIKRYLQWAAYVLVVAALVVLYVKKMWPMMSNQRS